MSKTDCGDPANELLLWYVNGTLEGEEMARVRQHVEGCSVCGGEVDLLLRVDRAAEREAVWPVSLESSRRRFALGVAAGLGLAALLVLGWEAFKPREASSDHGAVKVARVALGGGSQRSNVSETGVVLLPGVDRVEISFRVPVADVSRFSVELRDREQNVLASEKDIGRLDVAGGHTWVVGAGTLRSPGRYRVVVRERTVDGVERLYEYPFRVTTP